MSFNRVFLCGHVGNEPISRAVGVNTVVELRIATTERGKKHGEVTQHTQWHTVIAWNSVASSALHVRAGDMVVVEGRLGHRKYIGADNKPRYVSEITAYSVTLVDAGAPPELVRAAPKNYEEKVAVKPETGYKDPASSKPIEDDDLPF